MALSPPHPPLYSRLPISPTNGGRSQSATFFKILASLAVIGIVLYVGYADRGTGFYSRLTKNHDVSQSKHSSDGLDLDFAVVGFPKCGTTFLLEVLGQHPEVTMPELEFCKIHEENGVNVTKAWLRDASLASPSRNDKQKFPKKYGIKCPTMVRATNAIDNLARMSRDTRLVVGVRHPVLWFQSFYNFRVWEHHEFNRTELNETIIPTSELTDGTKHWRDVSTAYARYEIYLMQLAKVPLNQEELNHMMNSEQLWPKRISPNPFKVFIYEVDQLHHGNHSQFGADLQHFLGLRTPLPDLNSIPKANYHGDDEIEPPGHIDICNPQYRKIRKQLLQHGKRTSKWISEKFIESDDVYVSDKKYFTSLLKTWSEDPCNSS